MTEVHENLTRSSFPQEMFESEKQVRYLVLTSKEHAK